MSDAREGVNEALRQNKLLLAKLQVREDDLVKEIEALDAERAAAGDEALRAALTEKIAQLQKERVGISQERDSVRAELGRLDKLRGKIPVLEAQALAREALAFTGADPDAVAPPARMSEEAARAELEALKAQRAAKPAQPADEESGAAPDDPPPRKRTL